MEESDFDWNGSYAVPAGLRFRPAPSGGLQVDNWGGDLSVEVPRDWVSLYLLFARSQTAEAAYEVAGEEWDGVDRESFRELLQSWAARGLLQAVGTSLPVPSRLALFTRGTETGTAHRVPLRSHFELQRPLEFYPGLETRELHDSRLFPWVAGLEASFPVIQEEFNRLANTEDSGSGFSPVYRGQTSKGEWAASFLWTFGKQVEETCRLCPETTRLLSAIPGVAEFGTTLYSALAPHTQIAPHYGYSNAKLRCQLPIRVPGRCKLKVGEHEIEQREGKCIVFDDSFLHSAWNDSDEARFVLVFDFYHPDLAPEEVQYLARLAQERELAKFYQAQVGERVAWVADPTH
jgi:hypothetical protein